MKPILLAFAAAAISFAQPGGTPPTPTYDNITSYLALTTTQVTNLQAIKTAERTALKTLYDQLRTAQQKLQTDLRSSASATVLAADTQAVKDLQAQITSQHTTYVNQALALLTADQKTKVAALNAAAQLGTTIREGVGLDLVTPPARPDGSLDLGPGGPGGPGHAGGPGGRHP